MKPVSGRCDGISTSDGHAEKPRDRRVGVDAAADAEIADAAAGQREDRRRTRDPAYDAAEVRRRRWSRRCWPARRTRRGRGARFGAPIDGTRDRNWRLPPSASLPYCALLGPRSTSTESSKRGIDQIEKRVDAAALRRGRIADAVDEDVDLVAGQAADENARHHRARPLHVKADLLGRDLRHDRLGAQLDLVRIDHVHRLR